VVLRDEFLLPLGLSAQRVATDIGVPNRRIQRIVKGTEGLTADTALRLARYFGNSVEFWMALRGRYERERAERSLGKALEQIQPLQRNTQ
jgi:addiction module HigA family antidote